MQLFHNLTGTRSIWSHRPQTIQRRHAKGVPGERRTGEFTNCWAPREDDASAHWEVPIGHPRRSSLVSVSRRRLCHDCVTAVSRLCHGCVTAAAAAALRARHRPAGPGGRCRRPRPWSPCASRRSSRSQPRSPPTLPGPAPQPAASRQPPRRLRARVRVSLQLQQGLSIGIAAVGHDDSPPSGEGSGVASEPASAGVGGGEGRSGEQVGCAGRR